MCKQKNCSILMTRFVNHHQQQGFSLVMVMMIMVVIALLVIAGAQVSNTEMRISTNNADQKYAKGLAERALLAGEDLVTQEALVNDPTAVGKTGAKAEAELAAKFPVGGKEGLYGYDNTNKTAARTTAPIWEIDDTWNDANSVEAKVRCKSSADCKNPRYIVEYLGIKDVDGEENLRVFRITARAWGENENTVSTVQSVIVAPSS